MNMIASFISAALFYLFPALVGRAVIAFVPHKTKVPIVGMFVVGALVLYVLALLSHVAYVSVTGILPTAFAVRVWTIVVFTLTLLGNAFIRPNLPKEKNQWIDMGILAIITIVGYALWRWDSPYPSPLNWDIYEHQTLVNTIASGNLSVITGRLSDTFQFNGYTSLFHVLATLPQVLIKSDILGFWWWAELFHLATTVAASYVLAKAATNNRAVSLLSAILSVSIFESSVVYAGYFLIPQTLVAVVTVVGLAWIVDVYHHHKTMPPVMIASIIGFLFITHYIVGIGAAVLLIAMPVVHRYQDQWTSSLLRKVAITIPIAVFLLLSFIGTTMNLTTINGGEAAAYNQSPWEKTGLLTSFYGYGLLLFGSIGAYAILRLKHIDSKWILAAAGSFLALSLSPIPYALKFYVIGRYFVHVILAIGIWYLLKYVKTGWVRSLCYGITIVAFLSVFLLNSQQWKNVTRLSGKATHVSTDERDAAHMLQGRFADNTTLLISDPATQYVLEALSGVNTQGGAYMNRQTRVLLDGLTHVTTGEQMIRSLTSVHDTLGSIQPKTILFVVSGRYMAWQDKEQSDKYNIAFNIWSPTALSLRNTIAINTMSSMLNMQPIYKNAGMAIFSLPVASEKENL